VLALGTLAPAGAAPPDGEAYFEKEIRPILAAHCYQCHSTRSSKIRANLTLDAADAWLKGGDLGPAVEPGNPDESLLVQAVRYNDDALKMPPKGKLSEQEIIRLERWVKMGAPGPRTSVAPRRAAASGVDLEAGRAFWSFRPPADPPVPDIKDSSWPTTTLDRFVLAALEAKGLRPAPAADRRTLIRRATFDLTGLPPTPEEVDAFLADASPEAFARVVDRLLASPQYGERWGRHWLDVARYSDSNGLDENVAFGNAWRYRDYVIDAFNRDLPFDRFLIEQLAGDLLPSDGDAETARRRLIATGFLALGPKVLAEPDEAKMEMDIIDEQVDTVGKAFLGLTLGCARCHDHKFDPISTADYYGLAGIFKSTRTMETFKKVAKWYEHPIGTEADRAGQEAHAKRVAALDDEIQGIVQDATEALGEKAGSLKGPALEARFPAETRAELKRKREAQAKLKKEAPEVPGAIGVTEGQVVDAQINVRGNHLSLGDTVPRRVPLVLAAGGQPPFPADGSGRLELARWMADPQNPLTARVMVNRVWRWHFGRGLVQTPDNFGALGDRPVHQPLLDWLACRFVEGGWSVKRLHRLILLSSTYQTGGNVPAKALEADPENRLLARTTPRRLEAEAIRDALLAVGGSLDTTMGGSLLHVKNRDYLFNHTSQDGTKYDTPRRSVYLPVVRNHMFDLFDLFDYADASVANGDRSTTTVAPQALFMMNSEAAIRAARGLADRLLADDTADDRARVGRLYVRAYARTPSEAEAGRALRFLDAFTRRAEAEIEGSEGSPARRRAWEALCQAVLASNEFLYVR
jgi:hypothetical protein